MASKQLLPLKTISKRQKRRIVNRYRSNAHQTEITPQRYPADAGSGLSGYPKRSIPYRNLV